MSKPNSYFPINDFPNWQELGTNNDTNGLITQLTSVTINAGYASSGAVSVTAAATPFSAWPGYGFIQNLSTNEILFYDTISGGNTLNVSVTGRGLAGSVAAAGLNGQNVNFIEARILGTVINVILAELAALNKTKTVNTVSGTQTLTTAQSQQTFVNTALATYNLPAAAVNLRYRFINAVAGGSTIVANGTNVIYEGVTVSAAGGNLASVDIIGVIELVCYTAGKWCVVSKIGTWSVT